MPQKLLNRDQVHAAFVVMGRAYGAGPVADTLTQRLSAHNLGDDVLVTTTGCLFPCNLGPVVVVHPDDTWYQHVNLELATRIADDHLRDGHPVNGQPPRPRR